MSEKSTNIPLTQSQLTMWLGQKLNPDVPLYNVVHTFTIEGILDVSRFCVAFQQLVSETDALRIVLPEDSENPTQTILDEYRYDLEVLELPEDELKSWVEKSSRRLFTFEKPLFDSALIKVKEKKFVWYLNIHHIVSDVSSSALLFNRMSELYQSLEKGQALKSFEEYLRREHERHQGASKNGGDDYWANRLAKLSATSNMYGVRKTIITPASTRVPFFIGKERIKELKKLANQPEFKLFTESLSLFNIFATALCVLIYRISGQNSISLGVPSQNRPTEKDKKTAGLLISVLPLGIEIEEADSFIDVYHKMRLESTQFLRHSASAIDHSALAKSFNCILNYITTTFGNFANIETVTDWVHPGNHDPNHILRCHIYDFGNTGVPEVYFDLNSDVFAKNREIEFPKQFGLILDAFIRQPEQAVGRPSLVNPTSALKPIETSETKAAFTPVIWLLEKQMQTFAKQVAVIDGENELKYRDLDIYSGRLATKLSALGIGKGSSVALHMHRNSEYLIAVLATMRLGAAFIPIASDQPLARVNYILENSKSDIVLSDLQPSEEPYSVAIPRVEITKEIITQGPEAVYTCNSYPAEIDLAYVLYTSGSTGKPKGVKITNEGLSNYLLWARDYYKFEEVYNFPLFTSIGFDLTITSTFLPLLCGGKLIVYGEEKWGPDMSLIQVLDDNKVNAIKLTPSHLALMQDRDLSESQLKLMIVGGEDFKVSLADKIQKSFGGQTKIYNEYGPTEATVGCVVTRYKPEVHLGKSVPIGTAIAGMTAYVLDSYKNEVPKGVKGELYLSGSGLAAGYLGDPELTRNRFQDSPFSPGSKIYRTGDLARENELGELEYLGRLDEQVKLNGFRIELSEIEANITDHNAIESAAVLMLEEQSGLVESEIKNCLKCGLPSTYPKADFDAAGVCHLCNSFKNYREQAEKYFKTEDDLKRLLLNPQNSVGDYDCLALLSGGKDSTYVLARLVSMGLKVLAFTLDNGYISDQAKANINKIVSTLGVDHIYGTTAHMNEIFVDSLHRHSNVCNGCFKTIYTLSAKIALEKGIPFIVTGLSRGQFFETRLTEELFWDDMPTNSIDEIILEARKLYHQEEDAVKRLLDVSIFRDPQTFSKVQFVDFYRFCDVSLAEMLQFLKDKVGWERPTDTGRSTNCLINQLGIHIHKKEKGYSNYAFPYSWDVRLGHKTREETLEEIDEPIDIPEVNRMMTEIGYQKSSGLSGGGATLVGYYTSKQNLQPAELRKHLSDKLPAYMIPNVFKQLNQLPLTNNGKTDKSVLQALNRAQLQMENPYEPPTNEIEELLEGIWKETLQLKKVGIHDNFIALGGHSLAAIRTTARINEELEMSFPLNKIFELPTIAQYAEYIETTIVELLEK